LYGKISEAHKVTLSRKEMSEGEILREVSDRKATNVVKFVEDLVIHMAASDVVVHAK
jgi:hypothetical protein